MVLNFNVNPFIIRITYAQCDFFKAFATFNFDLDIHCSVKSQLVDAALGSCDISIIFLNLKQYSEIRFLALHF